MKAIILYVIMVLSPLYLCAGDFLGTLSGYSTMVFNFEEDNGLQYERVLFIDQAGEDVFRLKIELLSLGYKITKLNYIYDIEVKRAVCEFQKHHGLKVDGVVGKNTNAALYEELENASIRLITPDSNISKAPISGYWITVNKNSNTLTLLKGKEIIQKYHIATGKKWTYTPEGKFRILNKRINPDWRYIKGGIPENPLGSRWLGLNIRKGWTFGIHGNNNPRSIGMYASNGCIRMYNQDVEYLYEFITIGTPVWIGSQNQLKRWGAY